MRFLASRSLLHFLILKLIIQSVIYMRKRNVSGAQEWRRGKITTYCVIRGVVEVIEMCSEEELRLSGQVRLEAGRLVFWGGDALKQHQTPFATQGQSMGR